LPSLSDVDCAWVAGLLEGEGCFHISKPGPNRPTGQLLIKCAMTDQDTVQKLERTCPRAVDPESKRCLSTRPITRRRGYGEGVKLFRKIRIPRYEMDVVFGSRKVIKDPKSTTQQHYYKDDIWTGYGAKVAELIPEGFIVYGELCGWTPDGAPLQKGYTYHLPVGEAALYVYRVSHINGQGHLSDLSWDGVKDFCKARGLKWTPELYRHMIQDSPDEIPHLDACIAEILDKQFAGFGNWNDMPLFLSDHKTVDEGVCIRQEGLVPLILKAKSPKFLEHETKLLDAGVVDLESAA